MKRFWTATTITRAGDGFALLLDGKPMRLPGGDVLPLGHQALAEAIAAEWSLPALGAEISYDDLPLTQLAATAALRIEDKHQAVVESIAAYGRSDLLCYRAADPVELQRRQREAWQPWLDWALRRHDAPLLTTEGIGFIDQPPQSLAILARAVAAEDNHGLAALGVIVPVLGSLVLGLAVIDGALHPGDAYRLSVLDELFQEERWGMEAEAAARRARAEADVRSAALYVTLTRGNV
jgi:chaperone required for assembly of F1-ATPase